MGVYLLPNCCSLVYAYNTDGWCEKSEQEIRDICVNHLSRINKVKPGAPSIGPIINGVTWVESLYTPENLLIRILWKLSLRFTHFFDGKKIAIYRKRDEDSITSAVQFTLSFKRPITKAELFTYCQRNGIDFQTGLNKND